MAEYRPEGIIPANELAGCMAGMVAQMRRYIFVNGEVKVSEEVDLVTPRHDPHPLELAVLFVTISGRMDENTDRKEEGNDETCEDRS